MGKMDVDTTGTLSSSTDSLGLGRYLFNTAFVFIWRMSQLVLGLGTVVAVLLYYKQDSMLYFPEIGGIPRRPSQNPRRYRSPSEHQIPFESHKIECEDGVAIHAWLLFRDNQQSKTLPTIVFFHGNAGNIGLRLPNALQMIQYLNANILMVEYRGYGESDSVQPSEVGLKLDAQAALNFITKHPKVDPASIFLFGRSLGGAVAFHLAQYAQDHQLPLAGVIVENTFTNIADMVDHLMPLVAPLKSLILRIKWDSLPIVSKLTIPIMFLAGARDELVPHSHMLRLFKASINSSLSRLHIVEDGTHNETWLQGGTEYWEAIKGFMVQSSKQTSLSSTVMNWSTEDSSSNAHTYSSAMSPESSIPIMPNNLLSMTQESLRSTTNSKANANSKTGDILGKKEL